MKYVSLGSCGGRSNSSQRYGAAARSPNRRRCARYSTARSRPRDTRHLRRRRSHRQGQRSTPAGLGSPARKRGSIRVVELDQIGKPHLRRVPGNGGLDFGSTASRKISACGCASACAAPARMRVGMTSQSPMGRPPLSSTSASALNRRVRKISKLRGCGPPRSSRDRGLRVIATTQ